MNSPLRRPTKPDGCSSAGGMGGEVGTTGAGVCVGVGYVGSVSVAGLAGGGGTACMGLLDGGVTVAGGGTGGATGCGLGFKVPGGAASVTGAPHCSQKSPSRSSGPLQKRQTTAPGWVTGLSKDFFNNSSSTSTIWSPRLGRAYSAGAPGAWSHHRSGRDFQWDRGCLRRRSSRRGRWSRCQGSRWHRWISPHGTRGGGRSGRKGGATLEAEAHPLRNTRMAFGTSQHTFATNQIGFSAKTPDAYYYTLCYFSSLVRCQLDKRLIIKGKSFYTSAEGRTNMEASGRVGYAVVGLGHFAEHVVLPGFRNSRKAQLVALVSGDERKARRLAKKFGASDCLLLQRLRAVPG